MQSEKSKIEKYIKFHNIEACLDVVINEVIEKRPSNPFKVLSTLLETKSLSEILDIKLSYSFCENNNLGLSCMIKTNLGVYASSIGFPYGLQQQVLSGNQTAPNPFNIEVEEDKVNQLLKGQDPRNMKHIERLIVECYVSSDSVANKDKDNLVKAIRLVITMSCFRAAAGHCCEPLFKFISSYYEVDTTIAPNSDIFKIPQPSISVANGVIPNLTSIPFQSLNLIPTPVISDDIANDDDTAVVFDVESSLLYIKRLLIKLQSRLDSDKNITITTSKSGTTTYVLPASTLGGDTGVKKAAPPVAAAKGKNGKGAVPAPTPAVETTIAKSDSAPSIGPIQMSSQFPTWVKILDEILKQEAGANADDIWNGGRHFDIEISIDLKNFSQSLTSPSLKVESDVATFLSELVNSSQRVSLITDPFLLTDLTSAPKCLRQAIEKARKINPDRKVSYCVSMLPQTKLENMDILETATTASGEMSSQLDIDSIEQPSAGEGSRADMSIARSIGEESRSGVNDDMKKVNKAINYIKLNIYEVGCFFQLAQLLLVARKSGRGVTMSTVNELLPETCDTFVSDFAVGLGVDYVEFGGLLLSDYNCKYTRLIAIQKEMK